MAVRNAIDCDTRFHPNHELAAQVLDSLTVEVAVINTAGAIIATNQAWQDFAVQNGGRPSLTGVGANYLDVCRAIRGGDRFYADRACQGISDVLAGKRHVFTLEYPCHSSTENRWFLLHVSPLKGDSSKAVTAHVSITDRKIVEHQLVETARLAAIGDAMKGLSHKGRNSLQQAQGFIDLLRYSIGDDSDARKLLDRIELAQHRLVGLYEEVLHYAEPMQLNCSIGRLDDVVEEAWASVLPVDDRLRLQHPTQGMDLECEMDRDAMWQVVKTLFDNAAETGSQTTRIDVSYQTGLLNHRPAITMVVSDNGPGIAAADHERVFEPFFTTKTIGTGLGLPRARRIVELHGGQIGLGASVLGGASFYLTLPRQQIAR
ncbi:Sensor protein ZraS [Stieleria maiorica]|uniref:histidine kinase n=1 Tax=Stieleria maiorica TaxID=2795974 RepID=A0A5B9MAV1_9BACT|nr:ATP-binding protein [Stieleria maiorica]QEF98352.1 Sensor protein ZraS [Stieleria maiorica]